MAGLSLTLSAHGQTANQKTATPIAATAATSVPALVNYAGAAAASDGKPLTGEASITFLIYKDPTGGEPLFAETQTVAIDGDGYYQVQLGAANPNGLPADLFSAGEARWIEVQVAGEKPQTRVLLASVPYALKAADAATLGGLPASAFALAGSNPAISATAGAGASGTTPDANATVTTPGGISGYLPKFSGANTIVDSPVFVSGSNVGIGTATPAQTLDVNGTTVFRNSVYVYHNGTATASSGVNSVPMLFLTEGYNSSTKAVVSQDFLWKAEIAGNNTAAPSSTLNLLYSPGTGAQETGFHFNPNGTINFAPGQTFPGGTGTGTITGVTAGTGLTGGGTSGKVTLNVDAGKIPLLAASNTFVGNQTITGNEYVSGSIGVGTSSPEAPIDIRTTSAGQLILLEASPGAWAINSFGGSSDGLAGRFVGGGASGDGVDGGGGIIVAGGSSLTETAGTAGMFYGGSSYSGQSGDGIDATYGSGYGGGPPGLAGHFTGNVTVTGTLTAGAKNFQIDHPLDPANKYLNHASTESSEMMNIYSGNVVTDESGNAVVRLPEWFEAVNGDFRYQLTVLGQFAQAIISKEIENHQFAISTNAKNVKVSWLVTAVRKDAYAKANPLVVEQEKPASERGFYIHPELYGQPAEKQTEWGRHPAQMRQMKAIHEARNATGKATTAP